MVKSTLFLRSHLESLLHSALANRQHPTLGSLGQNLEIIRRRRNKPTVFLNVLLGKHLGRHSQTLAVHDGMTKLFNRPLNTSTMMAKRTMRPVASVSLGFIEPIMEGNVVRRHTTPLASRTLSMFPRSHCADSLHQPACAVNTFFCFFGLWPPQQVGIYQQKRVILQSPRAAHLLLQSFSVSLVQRPSAALNHQPSFLNKY